MPSKPYQDLLRELRRYSRWVKKQNSVQVLGHLTDRDIDLVYEIAFLSAYVSFEVFIERQFVALLSGRPYYRGRTVTRRASVSSERVARDLVKGQNRFPKYLPVDVLENLAKVYFRDGQPFTNLSTSEKAGLQKGQHLRNHIAHRSHSTREKFINNVIAGVNLRPTQQTPAGYLRSNVSPHQDRLEQMISDLALVGKKFVE